MSKPRIIGPSSKYAYLLARVVKLEAGQAHIARVNMDFVCEVQSFTSVVYAAARQKGLKATVMTFPDTGEVVFAFYDEADYLRPNLPAYPVVKKMKGFS